MSKKKTKPPARSKPASSKAAPAKAAARRRTTAARPAPRAAAVALPTRRTAQATIVIFNAGGRTQIRTSPQLLPAGPGYIEWTVVDLTGTGAPVEITWPNGGPFGKTPIQIPKDDGWVRVNLDGAAEGRFKYTVTVGGVSEDPEVEIPEM